MKIPHSVDSFYRAILPQYQQLKVLVDDEIRNNVKQGDWHYVSRIKNAESFYVKAQQCRWEALKEDIFACTIVVPKLEDIECAIKVLTQFFNLDYRRPPRDNQTRKSPDSFVFDDVRLYLRCKHHADKNITGIVFECQVKTFLQHAWTIATHDLIYKPKANSAWAASRVAFEIKAMLEHAEVSIASISEMAESPLLQKSNSYFQNRNKIIEDLSCLRVDLGNHPFRIADSILSLLSAFKCEWDQVLEWLKTESSRGDGYGVHQYRYSVYEDIVSVIFQNHGKAIECYQQKMRKEASQNKKPRKLFVPNELLDDFPQFAKICETVSRVFTKSEDENDIAFPKSHGILRTGQREECVE